MRLASILWSVAVCAVPSAAYALDIAICEDKNEWPPYSYAERVAGNPSSKVVGYAVDVIDEMFKRLSITYSIELLPWGRCLAMAALGQKYQMVLNLSYSPERHRDFLFSRAYYDTNSHYYYSRRNHPQGLAIKQLADLKKYRVCGVFGYNYASYGLKPSEVDQHTKDFPSTIAKVHARRCDLFLEKQEIMHGYAQIGKDYLAGDELGSAPVPGLRNSLFYLGLSRKMPQAETLMARIDDELLRMEESGRLRELFQRASRKTKSP